MIESKPLEVLWNINQVAKYFNVTTDTAWRWIRGGKIFDPAKVVHLGRRVLIPRSEIERITEQKKDQFKS